MNEQLKERFVALAETNLDYYGPNEYSDKGEEFYSIFEITMDNCSGMSWDLAEDTQEIFDTVIASKGLDSGAKYGRWAN